MPVLPRRRCLLWVKMRRTQTELIEPRFTSLSGHRRGKQILRRRASSGPPCPERIHSALEVVYRFSITYRPQRIDDRH